MLILTNPGTADKIQVVTGSAVTVDVHATHIDCSTATPPVVEAPSRTNTAISSATTTDVVAGPASGKVRNVKTLHIRNKGTASCDVTVQHVISGGTTAELHKATLAVGDMLEYVEGIGFFQVTPSVRLDARLRVASDVTNATTSFADITGLTCPVVSGKHYNFEAHLYHISNATTTGAQFGVNGPTVSNMRIQEIDVILGSLTAATMGSSTTDVTARDTAAMAETTGAATVVMAILSGWFNPSANGTFAVRCASEVAVASGLIVKAGSWCRIWEADN